MTSSPNEAATRDEEEIQRAYYERTAAEYGAHHVASEGEHEVALRYVISLMRGLGAASVLDVGAGTGRALASIRNALPGVELHGIEPVEAMIQQANTTHSFKPGVLQVGSGAALPFGDASVDVACCFGVLHHVREPGAVLKEMTRVARKAIFVSDSNRFGQGSRTSRWLKLGLYQAGLWRAANWVKTRGNGYHISEGDGLYYSYSVYDSYDLLRRWATRAFLIPTRPPEQQSVFDPILTTATALVCAIKDESGFDMARPGSR